MKKTIKALLIICCSALCLAFCLTACGDKCEHTYLSDCDDICNECGETRQPTAAHNYYGDCDRICHNCGNSREVTVEHSWIPATCTEGEACEGCGAVKSKPIAHSYTFAGYDDHYHYRKCSACGHPNDESKEKHVLDDEYACACGVQYTVDTFSGGMDGYSSTVISLYNSNENLVKKIEYANEELHRTTDFYYENGYLIKEETYLGDGSLDYYTLYEYDENGNETKREWYLGDGTPDGATLSEYNDNGDVIKETYTGTDGYFYIHEYEYDEDGNVIKEAYEDSDGYESVTEYEYDENGNCTKYSYETLIDGISEIGYEKYNESGSLTEEWIKFADGSTSLYEYYEDGVTCKRETDTTVEGTVTVKEYDEDGNKIKETYTDSEGNVTVTEYDSDGNEISA